MAERQHDEESARQRRQTGLFKWTPEWSKARFVATCFLALAIGLGIGVAIAIPFVLLALYTVDMMEPLDKQDKTLLLLLMLFVFPWFIFCLARIAIGPFSWPPPRPPSSC